jgi:tRNA 2-thiouridine synthesizing protein D
MKIGVLLLSGPYQTQDVDSMIHFVEAAMAKGHEIIGIFLYTDGVYNLNAKIKAPGDRNLAEELDAIGARDVPVIGCGVCCKFRGIVKADTIEHGKLGGLGALDGYLERCDRFITFGG